MLGTGSLISLAHANSDPESIYMFAVGLVIDMLGFVAFYTGLRSPARGFLDTIELLTGNAALLQTQALRPTQALKIPTENWQSLHLHASPTNKNSSRQALRSLFLKLNDNSYFWLAGSTNSQKLQQLEQALMKYAGRELPVYTSHQADIHLDRRPDENGRSRLAGLSYLLRETSQEWVKIARKAQNIWYSLKPPHNTLIMKFMVILIILFFFLVPGMIVLQAWVSTKPGEVPIGFIIGGSSFYIFWYSILSMIVLMQLKRIQLCFRHNHLVVRVDFRWLPFFRRELKIPFATIQGVPVHRVEECYWQLNLDLSENMPMNLSTRLLLGLTHKPGPPGSRLLLAGHSITLFEIPAYYKKETGPGLADLLNMRQRILESIL